MKSIYKYILSLPLGLMLFGMQSCSDDKTEDESGPRPVILKAEVFTAGNDAGATWSSGQSLGVYMLRMVATRLLATMPISSSLPTTVVLQAILFLPTTFLSTILPMVAK